MASRLGRSIAPFFRPGLVQHFYGLAGQVSAAAPLLLVTVFVSHSLGLGAVGRFVVIVGLSAAAFALAQWGLRAMVVLDAFKAHSANSYLGMRMVAMLMATTVTVGLALWLGVAPGLIVALILLRLSDAAIDLHFAFLQVHVGTSAAMRSFAMLHGAKLGLVAAAGGGALLLSPVHLPIGLVVAALTACVLAYVVLLLRLDRSGPLSVKSVFAVAYAARWFALAAGVCAIATSAPRMAMPMLYHGENLGVVGAALSVSTFFGMAFYTTWLRYLPRFRGRAGLAQGLSFIAETVALGLLMLVGAVFVLPTLVALVFGFSHPDQVALGRQVLVASVIFFAGMSLVNLYKATSVRWMEPVTYALAIAVAWLFALALPDRGSLESFLVIGGATMAVISFGALGKITSTDLGSEGVIRRAAFARISSRPIPRVERMMKVADSMDYDCTFLAARREHGLADQEVVDGLKVRRVGPYFPLLNGRAPWLYVKSVIGYNWGLYRALREVRPDVVHASDIETAPGVLAFKLTSGARMVYNIHDNLAQRYNPPRPIRALMNAIEGVVVRLSDVTLVPEAFRRDTLPSWSRHKIKVVRNTPVDRGIAEMPPPGAPIKIFFGGWLDRGRGLIQLLDLVRENEDFELTIAGEGDDELVRLIRETPRTTFLGFVGHDRVMQETANCHIVSALYDPRRPINRYAASNKLAEALSLGRPALVNSEMLITEDLAPYQCLVVVPYNDVAKEVAERLRQLVMEDGCGNYRRMSQAARRAYEELYDWRIARAGMADALSGGE